MNFQFSKTQELLLGIIVLVLGIFQLIFLIKQTQISGFEYTWKMVYGFKPAWIFAIGMVIGGVTVLVDFFIRLKDNSKRLK